MNKKSDFIFTRTKAFQQSQDGLTIPATILFKRLLHINSNYPIAYCALATLSLQQQNYSHAEKLLKRAIILNLNYIDAYFDLGICFVRQRKFEQAAQAFQKVINLDPYDIQAHCELANCLQDQGRYNEAFATYERALKIDPNHIPAYNGYGQALIHIGSYQEATEQFKKVLVINPDELVANNNMGLVSLIQQHHEEAIRHFKIATSHDQDGMRVFAWINWSMAEFQQDKKEEALGLFKKGMEVINGTVNSDYGREEIIEIFKCTLASLQRRILNGNDCKEKVGIEKTIGSFQYALDLLEKMKEE